MPRPPKAQWLPALSFSVQYASTHPGLHGLLPRWRLRRWVQRALRAAYVEGIACGTRICLTLRLVDEDEGHALNRDFRGRDAATNVLTFAYGSTPEGSLSADIVLCLPVCAREALAQQKPLHEHAAHLLIHGCLHALGYDHKEANEAQRMEALESRILAGIDIADPYRSQ